ncbi:metallophosphoesterase family protein [Geodermatophilus sabuli]|uniref:metallophosphoesterase family protein n=1 Tax=Geodermatophilus sabuli TaxID=1564158 RepID=UPI000BE3F9B7|nr:metallophosphoesterase [Geodermatophilus sabuli]MBB3085110.1 putative MPP superfamily phosphohydrolase [Geodermatophilus sabuli]
MSEPSSPGPARGSVVLRRAGRWALRLAVVLAGAFLGILLLGRVDAQIGPFDATVAYRPLGGGADLDVPPLGALQVDAFDGPLRLEIQLSRVDEIRAQALATDPTLLDGVVDRVSTDLQDAVVRVTVLTAVAAIAGAMAAALLMLRRRREVFLALGLSTALVAGTGGLAAATWRPEALLQPTYTGLLVNANSLIGSAQDIVARFDAYRASLEDLVTNVSTLYSTLSALPAPGGATDSVALLHVSDLHLNPAGFDLVRQVVTQFDVDGVLDTGDITDWGSEPENQLIGGIGGLGVPYVFIRGNHDSAVTAGLVAAQPNATVLDDSAVTVAGIEVVGTPDPRFTPDQDATGATESLEETGEGLAEFAETFPSPPAIAMVHDPKQATPLDDVVPLVLAGHTHERDVSELDGGTRLMVQGSTGGAGLRGLQGEYPEPLTCTVLYLDPATGVLTAYDEITLGGLGETEVTIERVVVPPPGDGSDGSGGDGSPDGDGGFGTNGGSGTDGDPDGSTPPASPTG